MSKNKLISSLKASELLQRNKTTKDITKKDSNTDEMLQSIRNFFTQEKEKDIKDGVLRDKRTLYKLKKDYYEPIRNGNAFKINYIEYESNGDKDKTLSIKEYLDEIRPYLNNLIDDHRTQGEWKIQLTMAIRFFLLKILKKLVLCIPSVIT